MNGTFLFSRGEIVCNLGRSFVYQNQIKLVWRLCVLQLQLSQVMGVVPISAATCSLDRERNLEYQGISSYPVMVRDSRMKRDYAYVYGLVLE